MKFTMNVRGAICYGPVASSVEGINRVRKGSLGRRTVGSGALGVVVRLGLPSVVVQILVRLVRLSVLVRHFRPRAFRFDS